MPLDGLRAWIGEVERKLGMRTRVFLALATIAIGVGGAAIYLAIDTRDNAVSESDVRELQEQLEAQIGVGGGAAGATELSGIEAELDALEAEVERLQGKKGGTGGGSSGGGASSGNGTSGGASGDGGTGGAAQPGTTPIPSIPGSADDDAG